MRGGIRIYHYDGEPFDLDKMENEAAELRKEKSSEDTERNIKWVNSIYVRRLQRSGRDTAGAEAILRPRQEDLDIASLQHSGVPDEQK